MGHLIYEILNNSTAVYVFWGLCFLSFVLFVIYALSKEGRDEHGRAILGDSLFLWSHRSVCLDECIYFVYLHSNQQCYYLLQFDTAGFYCVLFDSRYCRCHTKKNKIIPKSLFDFKEGN